jgi:Tol biopolymer transport system component
MRQLTNDPFGDSGPAWSPDGKRIAFHSNRGGKGDIWTVNVDGSNLQQVTDDAGDLPAKPVWFRDGKRLAVLGMKNWNTLIVDLSKPFPVRTLQPLACEDTLIKHFWAVSVSADGNMLAGMVRGSRGVYVYHMTSQKLQRQFESGIWPLWLNDNRRFLYTSNGTDILVFDMNTRKSHEIMKIPEGLGDFKISDDNKKIYYVTGSAEADIWLATLK